MVLIALEDWGDTHMAPDGPLYQHRNCLGDAHVHLLCAHVHLLCDQCKQELTVEHPELIRVALAKYPTAKLEADIRDIYEQLRADPRSPLNGGSPGHVRLRAPFADIAAELHRKYGAALEITLGHKRFPPERIGARQPVPLPTATVTVAGLELSIIVDDARVAPGEDLDGRVVFSHHGSQRVLGMTGMLTGGVRAESDGWMAGNFTGSIFMIGLNVELDPGASMDLPLKVGTASLLPDASYVVPPGRYEVVAAIPFYQPETPHVPRPQLVARGAWLTVDAPPVSQ